MFLATQSQDYSSVHDGFREVSNPGQQLRPKGIELGRFVIVSGAADDEGGVLGVA